MVTCCLRLPVALIPASSYTLLCLPQRNIDCDPRYLLQEKQSLILVIGLTVIMTIRSISAVITELESPRR